MFAWLTAVIEDVVIGASRFFEGVSQNRQQVEGALFVDRLSDSSNRIIVPGQPGGINGNRAKRIAEDIANQVTENRSLLGLLFFPLGWIARTRFNTDF
jgi:hypothetical protein